MSTHLEARQCKRRILVCLDLRVNIGTTIKQERHRLQMAVHRRQHQWRNTELVKLSKFLIDFETYF